jgi:uncharacterized RDD family membrane protein YckC
MQSSKAKHQVMAYLFDLVIVYAFFLLLFAVPIINMVNGVNNNDSTLILYSTILMVIFGAIFMLFIIFYFVIMPLFRNGQTIGKMFFKIKVIRVDNQKLDASTLFLREIVGRYFINLLTLGLNDLVILLVICLTDDRRGFHDVLASTRIVDVY